MSREDHACSSNDIYLGYERNLITTRKTIYTLTSLVIRAAARGRAPAWVQHGKCGQDGHHVGADQVDH